MTDQPTSQESSESPAPLVPEPPAAAPPPPLVPLVPEPPAAAPPPPVPAPAFAAYAGAADAAGPQAAPERPELAVGAAFAGGLVLALILKRLAR